MKYYKEDYMVYDEYGLKSVNCMRCNDIIKERHVKEQILPNMNVVNVFYMKVYSHARQVPYELDNGSITNILMCADCADIHSDSDDEKKGMLKQLKRGWELELEKVNASKDRIDIAKNRIKKVKQKYKEI